MSHDAAMLEQIVKQVVGECRVCGCHGDSCSLPEGERCVWVDRLRTLCSNPPCLMAAGKEKRSRKFALQRAERDARNQPLRRRNKKQKVKGRAA